MPNGARFYRADLHVHSFGASHDVKDATMSPEAIVAMAVKEGLHVLAIADHNEIGNVELALKAAVGTTLLVVPAVELSTSDGHLLCYLPTLDVLRAYHGRLQFADRGTGESRCQTSILESLSLLDQLGGFGVLAHVDIPAGFETKNPTQTSHKLDVLSHKALLGIELKSADSTVSYSASDPEPARRQCGETRIQRLKLADDQHLARLVNSDAHSLKALGRNAAGLQRVTRVKMDSPSFVGLRLALEDCDARVRIEDEVPESTPRILGIAVEGGFLDGQQLHFSSNLNCIIGGRGTGKSTLFEAVRCLSGEPGTDHVDSDVWPQLLWLYWQDAAGQQHTLYRPHGSQLMNYDDPLDGPTAFPIESYGQAETTEICKEAQKNPAALIGYLDRFIDTRQFRSEEQDAIAALSEIHRELEAANKLAATKPELEKSLAFVKSQLAASEQAHAKDLIALQRNIAEEQEVRKEIVESLAEIRTNLSAFSPKDTIAAFTALADPAKLVVGGVEFKHIVKSAELFEASASAAQGTAGTSFDKFKLEVEQRLKEWMAKENNSLQQVEQKRKELEQKGIQLNSTFIQGLVNNEAKLGTQLNRIKAAQQKRIEQEKLRRKTLEDRWAARGRVAAVRVGYAAQISARLGTGLADLHVSLKFTESGFSPEAADLVSQVMGWKTAKVPRASLLLSRLGLADLIKAIDVKNIGALTSVQSDAGERVFSGADANEIIIKFSELANRYALERCAVSDLPKLTVSKKIIDSSGVRYIPRDFSKLSLGQQQSVLLALMLSSDNSTPLIIDQPEDNLDGEFIYKGIVPVLRKAKERRQIIVVTHVANIAVLGDAEQIVALKSTSEKGSVVARGSIDEQNVRDAACNILEGAEEAFRRRAKVYGVLK